MRIAFGQLNVTVGDLAGNVERMRSWAERAAERDADLVVFPELAVPGYPPEDLVLRGEFVRENEGALAELAKITMDTPPVIAGFLERSDLGVHDSSALMRDGRVEAVYRKVRLPNYGVFDERRYFVPGNDSCRVRVAETDVGLSVCEDVWGPGLPWTGYVGAKVVVNINGSPYHRGKTHEREDVLRARARETGAPIAYVNMVGGQDELVFDGGSMLVDAAGQVTWRAPLFEESLAVVELDGSGDPSAEWPSGPEEIYRALVLGLGDYGRKNGFRDVVVAVSGGIDSSLVATLAVDALGSDAVRTFAMPSPYSSDASLSDARELAERLGVRLDVIGITEAFETYRRTLEPLFEGRPEDITEENLQSRIRGTYLMALSNKLGSLVLATGNKSEYAVGYATLYGDMAGGFAPIKDVPKTLLYELCRWRNERARAEGRPEPIPREVIDKPPTAELRPNQLDTDSLPPYEELDPVIEAYVERDLGVDDMVAEGFDRPLVERVVRMIDRAEYKRRQAAPGVKITPKAFGRDRRMPITNRYPG